jgi:hypothetical protein
MAPELRSLVGLPAGEHDGIALAGNVGATSHMYDQAQIPPIQKDGPPADE